MGATLPHAAPPSGAPPHWPSELRRQGRRGSAAGGVGRPFRQKSNRHAASERAAPAGAPPPTKNAPSGEKPNENWIGKRRGQVPRNDRFGSAVRGTKVGPTPSLFVPKTLGFHVDFFALSDPVGWEKFRVSGGPGKGYTTALLGETEEPGFFFGPGRLGEV